MRKVLKPVTIGLLLLSALLLASCMSSAGSNRANDLSVYCDTTGETLPVENNGSVSVVPGQLLIIRLVSPTLATFNEELIVSALYDPEVLTYLGPSHKYSSLYSSRREAPEGMEYLFAPTERWEWVFYVNENMSGTSSLTIDVVDNDASPLSNAVQFSLVSGNGESNTKQMSDSTRLGNLRYDVPFQTGISNLSARGLVAGRTNNVTVRLDSINSTSHDYTMYVVPLNYKNYVEAWFGERNLSDFVSYRDYSTSRNEHSNQLSVLVYGGIRGTAEFNADEPIVIRVLVHDRTTGEIYYDDLSFFIEDFNRTLTEIGPVYAATNGNLGYGAIAGTDVYIDAALSAFSVDDQSSNYVVVISNDSMDDVTRSGSLRSGSATQGTLSGGWSGDTTPFSGRTVISFVPKTAGTYNVSIYVHSGNGYNITRYQTTFEVTN